MWGFLGSRGGDKNPEWGFPTNVGGVMTRCHMTSDWMSHSKGRKTKKWNKPMSNVSPEANMTLFLVLGDEKPEWVFPTSAGRSGRKSLI